MARSSQRYEISDGVGVALVADEAVHIMWAALFGRQAFEHAKLIQANPTKRAAKKLGFPCFSLAESGFSRGLRRIQIKNHIPCHTVIARNVNKTCFASSFLGAPSVSAAA